MARTLAEYENDDFEERTQVGTLYRVAPGDGILSLPFIVNRALTNYPNSLQRPLFMLVRYRKYRMRERGDYVVFEETAETKPQYRVFRFTLDDISNLMKVIDDPFRTKRYETLQLIWSDFLYILDRDYMPDDYVHEVTHVGFFTTPKERYDMLYDPTNAMSEQEQLTYHIDQNEELKKLIYKEFRTQDRFDERTGGMRTERKGNFLAFAFNYEKLKEDTELGRKWKDYMENKLSFLEKFQIPFGQESKLSETSGEIALYSTFFIPCLLNSVKDQIEPELYDVLQAEKIIYGIGAKTRDFNNFLIKKGYTVIIYRIQDIKNEARFKINRDIFPKRTKLDEHTKKVEIMFWEGHWMPYNHEILRLLEESKRQGFLRPLNAFEYAQHYDNFSYDKMIKFDLQLFLERTKNGYIFSEADYDKIKYKTHSYPKIIFFADFESTTNETFHRPFLVCCKGIKLEGNSFSVLMPNTAFWGEDCGKKMLEYISQFVQKKTVPSKYDRPQFRLYFYNLRYDITFIVKYLHSVKRVLKGNNLYSATAKFKIKDSFILFDLWDALPIFRTTLKEAANNYLTSEQKENVKKEVFPYTLYTYQFFEKYKDGFCPFEEFQNAIPEKERKDLNYFVVNSIMKDDKIDYKLYAEFYCKQDVECLTNIMLNFAKLLNGKELEGINGTLPFSLDLWRYRTASTIGYDYFKRTVMLKKNGGEFVQLHDWFIPKQLLRNLIQQSIRGGRVMCRDNQKWYYKATDPSNYLQDYDGVALYPSAMSLLWLTEGIPEFIKGEFNENDIIKNFAPPECDDISKFPFRDGVIHVTQINVKKDRHFPLLCVKNPKTKLNNYTNFHNEPLSIWVNVIDLFNLIEFQQAEIKWDAAIVWKGDRFYEIRESIQKLFDFRAKNKKHPIQIVIKLVLNSIFGKSILKPQDKEKVYVEKIGWRRNKETNRFEKVNKFDEFFNANAYRIHKFEDLNDDIVDVELYKRDTGSSFNIFGSNVLAMARRIIGRIMALAEDIEEEHPELSPGLFYTDTDSMHIRKDLLQLLEVAFKEKYGKEIKGAQLTQFHVDFDLPKTFKKEEQILGAEESYFIMKKVYADKLVGDMGSESHHMRLKGIPIDLVKYEDYKKIYDGESINYDLLDGHTRFFYKNGHVGSRLSMNREIMTQETRLSRPKKKTKK